MSKRTAEANKAIRLAWEREQKLVQEGKGTRDWTKEQQKDILNSNKGKAYDDNGKALEGQHMKSVAEYPEFQGNPDNIQFLTKEEHFAAHKGSWQNPTNWYYNPTTKEFLNFGDKELIPCKVLELSNPLMVVSNSKQVKTEQKNAVTSVKTEEQTKANNTVTTNDRKPHAKPIRVPQEIPKDTGIVSIFKKGGKFIYEHRKIIINAFVKIIIIRASNSAIRNYNSKISSTPNSEKRNATTRAAPRENNVGSHQQHYHTKDGVVLKNKAPYHRGGKN